jgi:hypothetical protein
MSFIYDTIIIGSGIAGLYAAYKLEKKYPKKKILVLEKFKKEYIGGRVGNDNFYGVEVTTGAGIIRKDKDKLLLKLVKDFKIPHDEFIAKNQFAKTVKNPVNIGKIVTFLKKKYREGPPLRITFKEFALPILGEDLYNDFLISSGYTDYENEDLYESLYRYGMDDNENGWSAVGISWKELVDKISKTLTIKTSQNVVNISKRELDSNFVLTTKEGKEYICNQVIIATTIQSVRNLLHSFPIYKEIEGQPFLRMYGKFAKSSSDIMKQYVSENTLTPGPIHRIIPMDDKKDVYMIAYTDNAGAIFFKDVLKNTPENREYWCRILEASLGIEQGKLELIGIRDFYWPIGTHYYKPLSEEYKTRNEFIKKAQRPIPGIFVVGELISRNQGWVEGALESVEAIL